jgi:hypothetical protein
MTATAADAPVSPGDRLALLFEELSELTGQRNAIDGRIVEIVAEIDRDGLWGATGARSLAALVLTAAADQPVPSAAGCAEPSNTAIAAARSPAAAPPAVCTPTTSGPADRLLVPLGERADWWWYDPFQLPTQSSGL